MKMSGGDGNYLTKMTLSGCMYREQKIYHQQVALAGLPVKMNMAVVVNLQARAFLLFRKKRRKKNTYLREWSEKYYY